MKLTQRPWVKHVLAAWERLRVTNGNLYAAAITYFSFLALFPLILLSVSIVGFVLKSHPAALQTLFYKISQNAPGQFGTTLRDAIKTAIEQRTSVGIIGLVGVVVTGLGWIGNLRASLDAVWKRTPPKQNPIRQRVVNLVILAALGLGLLVSLALTAGWSAFSSVVLSALGLDDIPGMGTLLAAIGIAVTVLADAVIFFLVLVRIPQVDVPVRIGLKGALLAAVGFEVLKIAGTYTIAASAQSATAGPFAGVIAVLIWIQLVTRFTLFCAAWTAELTLGDPVSPPIVARSGQPAGSAIQPAAEPAALSPALSPAAVGAGLVGAGAAAGAAVTAFAIRRGRNRPD